MQLHQVRSPLGSRKSRKIKGRGRGSGNGKRAGKGQKGQTARAGRAVMSAYEGGQMRLLRRLPKVGFNSKWPDEFQIVNIGSLNAFTDGTTVNPELLRSKNLIKSLRKPVKILSEGKVSKKLTVVAHRFSKTASEAITKAGGKVQVIGKE